MVFADFPFQRTVSGLPANEFAWRISREVFRVADKSRCNLMVVHSTQIIDQVSWYFLPYWHHRSTLALTKTRAFGGGYGFRWSHVAGRVFYMGDRLESWTKPTPNEREVSRDVLAYRNGNHYHPEAKGLRHVQQWIRLMSRPGDLVVDVFSGSATTAIACMQTSRHFIAFEVNPEHYQVSMQRLRSLGYKEAVYKMQPEELKSQWQGLKHVERAEKLAACIQANPDRTKVDLFKAIGISQGNGCEYLNLLKRPKSIIDKVREGKLPLCRAVHPNYGKKAVKVATSHSVKPVVGAAKIAGTAEPSSAEAAILKQLDLLDSKRTKLISALELTRQAQQIRL